MKERLATLIGQIGPLLIEKDNSKICKILNTALEELISFIRKQNEIEQIVTTKRITLAPLKEQFDVNVGLNFKEETIELAEWIFKLQPRAKINVLYFLLVKIAFNHFLSFQRNDIKDAFVNIVALLWIKEFFMITSLDNQIFASVTTRIYPEKIGGYFYEKFNWMLNILFIKNVSYHKVFKVLTELIRQQNTPEGLFKSFNSWVNGLVTEIDVIAPIYLKPKLIPTLELIVEWGYQKGTTANIAKKLHYHINSVANQFRELSTRNTAFWRPIINLEKLKLNNYFMKLILPPPAEEEVFKGIYNMLWSIPYLKSIYTGKHAEEKIIYSPSLVCPHLVSERINEQLKKFQRKGWIQDFNLQLIRERYHYGTITTTEENPTIERIEEMLFDKKPSFDLRKFIFVKEKRDFSMEFDDRNIKLDYNLLFFLSALKCKYLLKSRYAAYVNELPKLYEKNGIPLTNVSAQIDFLNQIEIRARRRKILSYALFMKRFQRALSDILIFEIKANNEQEEKRIRKLTEKLQIFSFLGEMVLADKHIFPLPGISNIHPISKLVQKKIESMGLKATFYTIREMNRKFVPLHDLYDYDNQRWKIE